jgi:hypothetical protein
VSVRSEEVEERPVVHKAVYDERDSESSFLVEGNQVTTGIHIFLLEDISINWVNIDRGLTVYQAFERLQIARRGFLVIVLEETRVVLFFGEFLFPDFKLENTFEMID